MAAELARYGVSVRIVDKSVQPTDKSKAVVLWSRTLELLDRAGCTGAFVTLGNKVNAANIIADKTVIGHVNFSDVDSPYPFALMLPQSDTERLLEEHLGRLGINTQRQTELSRQKATHAVTPIARSAIPTSNWKGLTCHPM
jgi:2-polyprenyl-6-methoxyphenol hydroxylase-like FAD-dependent oxidoreductase